MLTKPGNTQVYSPFGTYVVEQHGEGFETPGHLAAPEPPRPEESPVEPKSTELKGLAKAA